MLRYVFLRYGAVNNANELKNLHRYQGRRILILMHTSRMHHRHMSTLMAVRSPTPIRKRTSTNTCTVTTRPILLRMYERRIHNHFKAQV
jgi:hypothetical protein